MARFSNILFVAEGDKWSAGAFRRVSRVAADHDARLTVLEVVEELPHVGSGSARGGSPEVNSSAIVARADRLKRLIEDSPALVEVEIRVVSGNALHELVREVLHNDHDLVALAARGDGSFHGSAAVQLVRKCPCAVWLMGPGSPIRYHRVMAGVDPDVFDAGRNALNTRILRTAAAMARRDASELHIAHAWTPVAEGVLRGRAGAMPDVVESHASDCLRNRMEEIDGLLRQAGVRASKRRLHLVKGDAVRVLPELASANHIDLLVLGTLNRSGLARWFLADTAEKVLRQVSCDVLVVKPDRLVIPSRLRPVSLQPSGLGRPANERRKEAIDEKYRFG